MSGHAYTTLSRDIGLRDVEAYQEKVSAVVIPSVLMLIHQRTADRIALLVSTSKVGASGRAQVATRPSLQPLPLILGFIISIIPVERGLCTLSLPPQGPNVAVCKQMDHTLPWTGT